MPKCSIVGSSCTSGSTLLDGKATNREPNPPNTLDACADGSRGAYHSDESIDEIRVSAIGGGPLRAGAGAEIEVKAWPYQNGSGDTADFYHAADANAPTWEYIGSLPAGGSGLRTLAVQFSLPNGPLQAVRVNFRYLGSVGECSGNTWDDVDDLAFSVAPAPAGAAAAAARLPPIPPVRPVDSGYCATIDKSNRERCVDICEWKRKGKKRGCYPKKSKK